jgi:hypothetical protein
MFQRIMLLHLHGQNKQDKDVVRHSCRSSLTLSSESKHTRICENHVMRQFLLCYIIYLYTSKSVTRNMSQKYTRLLTEAGISASNRWV